MPRIKKETLPLKPTYNGFTTPESNWFKMPNDWTDITASIDNLAELKVVEYVLRHTWGYREYGLKKHITLPEFVDGRRRQDGTRMDQGTGLSKRAVQDGLNKAVEHGYIEEDIDDADRARIKKYYSLKMRLGDRAAEMAERPAASDWQSLPVGQQTLPAQVANFASRSEKDTLEKHLEDRSDDDNASKPLESFGISKNQAQRLAATYPASLILEKLDQISYLVERRSSLVSRNPQGFLIKAIEENYLPQKPKGYKTKAERAAQAQQRQAQDAELEQARLDREQTLTAYKQHQQPKAISGTKLTTATSWERTLTTLQGQMTTANFNMWLKQTVLVDCRDGQALIAAPSTFVAEWLQARMVPIVKRALVDTLGQAVELQFTVAPELVPPSE